MALFSIYCRKYLLNVRYNCLIKYKKLSTSSRERIFSGIQPTGALHLGNYFGAVKKWVELQNEGKETIYSIVDLHSITIPQESEKLQRNIRIMAASLLACGIDPDKSILFLQSQLPEHTQLQWVLSCLMASTRLANLSQYKDKASKLKQVPLGLLVYPILQTADILLYKATHVPVGEDQIQHLEITSYLARTFNKTYGQIFPIPQPIIGEKKTSRLKSLREPDKKMSKSGADERSRIEVTDSPDEIVEKFKKSVTDCTSKLTYDPDERPGVSNLITIHSLFTGFSPEEICEQNSSIDTGQYKKVVAECVIESMATWRKQIQEYLNEPEYLEQVLKNGSDKAKVIAEVTWNEVRNYVGINIDITQNKKFKIPLKL